MPAVIIIVLILSYTGWVIYRKVKNMKEGKFCDCGCEDCAGKKCSGKKEE